MKNIISLLILIFSLSALSQEIKFVNALNGLIIRDAPNKNSNRIDKLNYGIGVYITKETGIKLSIKDNNKVINGQWVEINKPKSNKKGFVFDGFLTSKIVNKGKETENYYLTKIDSLAQIKYWNDITNSVKPKPSSLYLRNKQNEDLLEFPITELEMYDSTTLRESKITGLTNITKLIVIESTYVACCSSTDEHYYLVNSNNDLIKIPEINNNHCDGPEPYFGYIFPHEKDGQKNKVIFAKISPDIEKDTDTIDILKTFAWNGTELKLVLKGSTP